MTVVNKDFIVNNGLQIAGYITSVGGSTPTNGQLLIGDATNGRFSVGSLTGSNGISFAQGAGTINITTNATNTNTVSTIVSRDSAGAFSAGKITANAANFALTASNGGGTGQTSIGLTRTGAGTDNKSWELFHNNDASFTIRTVNDGYTASTNGLVINRNTGYGITNMQLLPGSGNVLLGTTTDDAQNKLQVNGTISVTGSLAGAQISAATTSGVLLGTNNGGGEIVLHATGGAADQKIWDMVSATGGSLSFRAVNDAWTTTNTWMNVNRTGAAVTTLQLLPGTGRLLINNSADDGSSAVQVAGIITATTPTAGDSSTKVATTAFVATSFAPLASPALTGTPTAPTATAGTNTTQVATTSFVATSFAPIASPTFTGRVYIPEGTVTAPGLTFVNDGTLDTGLYHISDGVFGITCNQVQVATFSNAGVTYAKSITMSNLFNFSTSTISAAGTTQGTATSANTANVIYVTGGTAGTATGVLLPPPAAGATCMIINNSGITITLYPPSGAAIDWGSANAGISVANQTKLMFVAPNTSTWFSMNATYA